MKNALIIGVSYASSCDAFATTAPSKRRTITALHSSSGRNSPGFVPFSSDDNPIRSSSAPNSRRPMDDPFAPPSASSRGRWQEPNMMYGPAVGQRQSNLSPYSRPSINDVDPLYMDVERERYSQRPHPSTMMPHHRQQSQSSWQGMDGRIQGGSRHTYDNYGSSQTFVETDGRPLHVEMDLYDGPNNTPTRVKMYSEDGRQRPMNILTDTANGNGYNYGRGGTVSIRNVGSMEFPINAGVSSRNDVGGYNNYGRGGGHPEMMMGGAPISPMGEYMMQPIGMRPNNYGGGVPLSPSTSRGETVQGGSLKTFTLPHHVNAAQVTITSDGLPVNAKVELWGTSTHVKQLAEVYNDNGQTRPFAAIIDVPGGENTIAVRNTGPMEYPIRVVVEPVGMGNNDMGGGGEMMNEWDGPPGLMGDMMLDDPRMMLPPGPPPPW